MFLLSQKLKHTNKGGVDRIVLIMACYGSEEHCFLCINFNILLMSFYLKKVGS